MIPKFRIGKDLNIKWEILVNGQIQDLSDADLTIILRDPNGKSITVPAFGVNIIRTDSSLNLTGELSYVVTDYQPIIDSYVTEEELTSTLIDYVKVDDISIFNNDFVVTITKWGNTYQADKTVPEINAAFDAGMNVYAKYHNNPWDTAFYMTARRSGNGAYIIYMSIYYGITLGEDKELLDKGVQYLLQTNSGIKQYSCNFNDYVSKTIFDSSLQNYYTKAEIDEMLNQIRNT